MNLFQTKLLNIFWRMIIFLLDILPARTTLQYDIRHAQKVALLSYGSKVGDSVIMTLFVRELKKKFPTIHITVGIKKIYKELFQTNPYVDQTIILPNNFFSLLSYLRKNKFDVILDIPFSDRKNLLAYYFSSPRRLISVQYHYPCKYITYLKPAEKNHFSAIFAQALELFGITNPDLSYDIFPTTTDEEYAETFLSKNDLLNKKFLLFNPQASSPSRSLRAEKVHEIINELNKIGFPTILLCHQLEYVHTISPHTLIFHTSSIMQTAALTAMSSYVLSVDTGIVHIADALKKKMTVLYCDVCNPGESPRSKEYITVWQPIHADFNLLRTTWDVNDIPVANIIQSIKENWTTTTHEPKP